MAIEGADAVTLADFDPQGQADILISAARAETLKLANQLAAADPDLPVLILSGYPAQQYALNLFKMAPTAT